MIMVLAFMQADYFYFSNTTDSFPQLKFPPNILSCCIPDASCGSFSSRKSRPSLSHTILYSTLWPDLSTFIDVAVNQVPVSHIFIRISRLESCIANVIINYLES